MPTHASPSVVFLSLRYLQHIVFCFDSFDFNGKTKIQRAVNAEPHR
jgi:hypothetical protein